MEATPDLNKEKARKNKKPSIKPGEKDKICPRCKLQSDELIKVYAVSFSSKNWLNALIIAGIVAAAGHLLMLGIQATILFILVAAAPALFGFNGKIFCSRCGDRAMQEMDTDDF